MNEKKTDQINVGAPMPMPLSEWSIDYNRAKILSAQLTRTVVDSKELRDIAIQVSTVVGLSYEAVLAILKLEASWPERSLYRASMPRDDGSFKYVGVTQAAEGFWSDVVAFAATKNFRLPGRMNATIFQQVLAPFIYLDRYRDKVEGHLFTAAMIYALHQQGPGAAKQGFPRIAGSQSDRSVKIVRVAQNGARAQAADVWL